MINENWNIAGFTLKPGEKKQVTINPYNQDYPIPATLINGAGAGKTIIISSGLHSGEYPGVAGCIKAAKDIEPGEIKGRLIMLHPINTSGFFAKRQGVVDEDNVNLNAVFPGDKNGTIGMKIAAYLAQEIAPQADFIMDLHSGGSMEAMSPCLFFPATAGKKVEKIALAAAAAISTPHLIASAADNGFYSYCAHQGIPGILVERGGLDQCLPDDVAKVYKDIFLLLAHFGLVPEDKSYTPPEKTVWPQVNYLVSQDRGLWYPKADPGEVVAKDGLIGCVEDCFGNQIAQYRTPAPCRVMYHLAGLAVTEGTPLAALGIIEKAHILA